MIISCFRCGKEIDTPDSSNADYVIAGDMVVKEPREVFVALKHNQVTLAKRAEIIVDKTETLDMEGEEQPEVKVPPTEDYIRSQFQDNEYDTVEVESVIAAQEQFGEDLVKVIVEVRETDIQKTGIICPSCYKPTDTVIWGVHKSGYYIQSSRH